MGAIYFANENDAWISLGANMKKGISLFLIFLMLISTSCYHTYAIKKEEIKADQDITLITYNEKKYQIKTQR